MNQELKILRDRLRESGGDGAIIHCKRDGRVLDVTGYTVREVVGVLDRLERESERVDGVERDV